MSIQIRRAQNGVRQRKARGRMFMTNRSNGLAIPHPPQIRSYGIMRDVRLRFAAGSAFNGPITYQNLLDTIELATTAIAPFNLFNQVQVKSVELWALPAIGAAATVQVIFAGLTVGAAGDFKLHTDTSMGIQPAHVKASPDPKTQAGQYQPSSTDVAFDLAVPTGAVVDVTLSFRNAIIGAVQAAQNASVGATVGSIFYRGLDGKALATTVLVPVGANNVA
jgi:hypothetical protein